MKVYQIFLLLGAFNSVLCIMLTITALQRRCQQLRFWAVITFIATILSTSFGTLLYRMNINEIEKQKYCNSIQEIGSLEYYSLCVDEETYCQAVNQNVLTKTKKYCDTCISRTVNISASGHTSELNQTYIKCHNSL